MRKKKGIPTCNDFLFDMGSPVIKCRFCDQTLGKSSGMDREKATTLIDGMPVE